MQTRQVPMLQTRITSREYKAAFIIIILVINLALPFLAINASSEKNAIEDLSLLVNLTKTLPSRIAENISIIILNITYPGNNISQLPNTKTNVSINNKIEEKRYHEALPIETKQDEIKLANLLYRLYILADELKGKEKEELKELITTIMTEIKGNNQTYFYDLLTTKIQELLLNTTSYPKEIINTLQQIYTLIKTARTDNKRMHKNNTSPQTTTPLSLPWNNIIQANEETNMTKRSERIAKELSWILTALRRQNYNVLALAAELIKKYNTHQDRIVAKYLILTALLQTLPARKAYQLMAEYGIPLTANELDQLKRVGLLSLTNSNEARKLLKALQELKELVLTGREENKPALIINLFNNLQERMPTTHRKGKFLPASLSTELYRSSQQRKTIINPLTLVLFFTLFLATSLAVAISILLVLRRKWVPQLPPTQVPLFQITRQPLNKSYEVGKQPWPLNKVIELYWKATHQLTEIVPRRDSETHREYLFRVREELRTTTIKFYEKLTYLYEKTRYAHREAEEEKAVKLFEKIESSLQRGGTRGEEQRNLFTNHRKH